MKFYFVNLWSGRRDDPVDFEDVMAEVPEGWRAILHKGFEEMFVLGWDGGIRQIKEKFGSLRLYVQNGSNELEEIISRMEEETENVCSVCGAPKTKTANGWIRYYCDEHFPEQK